MRRPQPLWVSAVAAIVLAALVLLALAGLMGALTGPRLDRDAAPAVDEATTPEY